MAGNYKHPKIELVITAEEETGMDGARGIDLSGCQSRKLINLDSEEEGVFLAGCAGAVSYTHLDVYKRQRPDRYLCCQSACRCRGEQGRYVSSAYRYIGKLPGDQYCGC